MCHTEASTHGVFVTTLAERTALVKMLNADYCGTGRDSPAT